MALEKQKKAPAAAFAPGDLVICVQHSRHITGTVKAVEYSTTAREHLVTLKRPLAGLIIHYASDLAKVPQ